MGVFEPGARPITCSEETGESNKVDQTSQEKIGPAKWDTYDIYRDKTVGKKRSSIFFDNLLCS